MVAFHHGGVVDRRDGIRGAADPTSAQELKGHDIGSPINPRYANSVVSRCGDRAGNMGSMAVLIKRVVVIIGEIPAVEVVYITILVIVNLVGYARSWASWTFGRIGPHIGAKVFMFIVDTCVNHPNNYVCRTGRQIPGFRCIDIGIVDIVESPQWRELWVVGGLVKPDDEIWFGVSKACGALEASHDLLKKSIRDLIQIWDEVVRFKKQLSLWLVGANCRAFVDC